MAEDLQEKVRYEGFEDALKLLEHIKHISRYALHINNVYYSANFGDKLNQETIASIKTFFQWAQEEYREAKKITDKYKGFDFKTSSAGIVDLEKIMRDFKKDYNKLALWIKSPVKRRLKCKK